MTKPQLCRHSREAGKDTTATRIVDGTPMCTAHAAAAWRPNAFGLSGISLPPKGKKAA